MTRLGDKVPVAPLDAARRSRIEDAVVASIERADPRPAPRLRWLVVGAATCAALLVAGYLGWRAAGPGQTALVPSVATRAGERARLELGDAIVELGEATRVSVQADNGGVHVALAQGRVDCDVEPRPGRAPFVVRAGDVAVEVIGTAFSVERDTDVRVRVTRGQVQVVRAGREPVKVGAGESWTRSGSAVASASAATRPAPTTTGPATRTPATTAIPPATPEPAAPESRTPARTADPTPTTTPSSTRSPSRGSSAAASDPAAPGHDLPAPSCPDVETCLAIALEKTGPEAGQALYSLVHHELFQEREPARAITHAELYERRFAHRRPREAEAVLWLRILAHRQAGDLDASRGAAQSYLARHPRGRFTEQAIRFADE
jgi:hypothetical protein